MFCAKKLSTTWSRDTCQVYNHVNYTELKNYKYPECTGKAHEGDVRALIFVKEHALLISASGDRSISIHDDSKRDGGVLLRRITNASWSEISVVRYSSHLGLIASGNIDGSIQVWNFEHARHEGCCHEKHQAPVTCLAFLDPFPMLMSTDAAGYLALWALPPAREGLRFRRIFTWINKQPVSDRMYGGGGGCDGETPVAVTALECQVEMISNTVAASSTAVDSGTISSEEGVDDSYAESAASFGEGGEEGEPEEEEGREEQEEDAGEDDEEKGKKNREGRYDGEEGERGGDTAKNGEAAEGPPAAPPEGAAAAADFGATATTADGGATPGNPGPGGGGGEEAGGGGGGGGGDSGVVPQNDDTNSWDMSPDPDGEDSCRDRSFQERLAATLRKYQGERRRHPQSTARSSSKSQTHRRRVLWNTEMLSYTAYTADEHGRVTTWDLKAVIIGLIHAFGGHEWDGHGVGAVQSPAVYHNAFRKSRHDAKDALSEARCRLEATASMEWVPDRDTFDLHRIGSWEAHAEAIICMNLVEDPPTVLTSAIDRLVKLWTPGGELRGVLRQRQDLDTPWTFRVNRRAHEERKTSAAEQLIITTKAPRRNRTTANTDTHQRRRDADTTTARTLDNTQKSEADVTHRDGCENGSIRGGDQPEEDRSGWGPSGHECLVDVSRRPARAPRKYAEEELDRYCESWTTTTNSTTTKVRSLGLAPSSLASVNGGDDSGTGVRRTPRRVPVRPNSSGTGVTRGRIRGGDNSIRSGSASPRAIRGQLVACQSLSAR